MGGLLLKLQNFKKVKLIFGHPVDSNSSLSRVMVLSYVYRTKAPKPEGRS